VTKHGQMMLILVLPDCVFESVTEMGNACVLCPTAR
jgi:hypothetical protein